MSVFPELMDRLRAVNARKALIEEAVEAERALGWLKHHGHRTDGAKLGFTVDYGSDWVGYEEACRYIAHDDEIRGLLDRAKERASAAIQQALED